MAARIGNARGFTLIELAISLVTGVVVLSAAISFAVTTWRTIEGNELRDGVYRSGRFVAMSLERDFQSTGVGITCTPSFGTLAAWGDTLVILRVSFDPDEAPPYDLDPPPGTDNPLPIGGTCGSECLDLTPVNGTVDLAAGQLARLQVNDERRLILVQSVSGTTVWFTAHTQLLRYVAGLAGGLRLDRFSTFVQRLGPIIYYLDGDRLMRAEALKLDGTPDGEAIANGVQRFEVSMIFTDGDEADEANPADSDPTNDFDDVVGVRIQAVLAADRVDPRMGGGKLFTREYEWRFAPRNLMYERNRI
jgi:hypothetical protein